MTKVGYPGARTGTRPVAVYAHTSALAGRLTPLLGPGVAVHGSWEAFERAVPGAPCMVVAVPDLSGWSELARFKVFRRPLELVPLLLVTRADPDNLREVRSVRVEELVWTAQLEAQFPDALRAAQTAQPLAECAAAVEAEVAVPAELRAALAAACRANPPIRSVQDLARTVGRDRRTLAESWSRYKRDDPDVRLRDVLDWIVLIRALALKRPGRSWTAVADALGAHEDTLFRIARRGVGLTPVQLGSGAQERVVDSFRSVLFDT